MSELVIPLGRDEVYRRLKRFRDGLQMSRRAFGEVQQIRQSGEVVTIYTTKHTIRMPADLWAELGSRGEEAVVAHNVASQKVH